ncbi:MAG: hypothetical protein AB1778_10315 [Candidatus Bipolaricaulota bacterium]
MTRSRATERIVVPLSVAAKREFVAPITATRCVRIGLAALHGPAPTWAAEASLPWHQPTSPAASLGVVGPSRQGIA